MADEASMADLESSESLEHSAQYRDDALRRLASHLQSLCESTLGGKTCIAFWRHSLMA